MKNLNTGIRIVRPAIKIVIAAMVVLVVSIGIHGFKHRDFNTTLGDTSLLTREKIIANIKHGEVTQLKDIGQFNHQLIYLLYPYQSTVDDKLPNADRINAYLRSVNYIGDEGIWSLVFVDDTQVRVVLFKRSEELDILGIHSANERIQQEMPANFHPADWVESEEAGFYTRFSEGRRYIVLGRVGKER